MHIVISFDTFTLGIIIYDLCATQIRKLFVINFIGNNNYNESLYCYNWHRSKEVILARS